MFVVLPILSSNSYFPLCLSIHSKIGKLALYFTSLFFLFQVKVNKLTKTFWTLDFLYMSVIFISSPGMDQGAIGRGLRGCVLNAYNAILQPQASHITIQKKNQSWYVYHEHPLMLSVGSNALIFMFWFISMDNNADPVRLKTTTFNRNYFGVLKINLALETRSSWYMGFRELSIWIYNGKNWVFWETSEFKIPNFVGRLKLVQSAHHVRVPKVCDWQVEFSSQLREVPLVFVWHQIKRKIWTF